MQNDFVSRKDHEDAIEELRSSYELKIQDLRKAFGAEIQAMHKAIDERFEEFEKLLRSSFPEGDFVRHAQYHLKQEQAQEERRDLWKHIKKHALSGILWLVLGFTATALWESLKQEVRK